MIGCVGGSFGQEVVRLKVVLWCPLRLQNTAQGNYMFANCVGVCIIAQVY